MLATKVEKGVAAFLVMSLLGFLVLACVPKPTIRDHRAHMALVRAQNINQAEAVFNRWCQSRTEPTPACR